MNREENQVYYASKRERLLGLTIFFLMIFSFFLHLSAFADIFFKNIVDNEKINQTNIIKNNSLSKTNIKFDDIVDLNILSFFCILAHLIWIIVPIVILDQCCLLNNKSIYRFVFKLIICTCPLLLSSELSIIFISQIHLIKIDYLIISIKWLIFLATILISFWTGILSDENKWRGIHGGQIAPETHSPLNLFQN